MLQTFCDTDLNNISSLILKLTLIFEFLNTNNFYDSVAKHLRCSSFLLITSHFIAIFANCANRRILKIGRYLIIYET